MNDKHFLKYVKTDRVCVFQHGVKFYFRSSVPDTFDIMELRKSKKQYVRNSIFTFTKSARRRMRDFMLSWYVPHQVRCGVTLTLPWKDNYKDLPSDFLCSFYQNQFVDVVHRFRVSWLRRFPSSGCVYRVELQKRKVPHIHLIAYHTTDDLPTLCDVYFRLWLLAVRDLCGGKLLHFLKYGVKVDTSLSSARALQYLSDHSSKSKQAQLGYKGKQWGIWGRDNFRRERGLTFRFLNDAHFNLFLRHVFRYRRYKIGDMPCVFGSKKSKVVPILQSCQYLSSTTLKRLFHFCRHSIRDQEIKNTLLTFFWYFVILFSFPKNGV